MNERIKQLRLLLNLTQEEFGKKLGVTRSAISYLESGRSKLTDQMFFMLCLTYNVSKEWLKNGTGEIFIEHSVSEELSIYMGKLMSEENPEKDKYALFALKLIIDEWDMLSQNIDTIKKIFSWISEKPPDSQSPYF